MNGIVSRPKKLNPECNMEKGTETFYPKSRQEWREWLTANHDKEQAVWLIYYKKKQTFQLSPIVKQLMKLCVLVG